MNKLPKNKVELANMIYGCIDFTGYPEGSTLKGIIKSETNKLFLTDKVVLDWLQGLPSACTIPFYNSEITDILESSGNSHWSIDDYWRWCASRVKAFALYPEVYK